MLTVLS